VWSHQGWYRVVEPREEEEEEEEEEAA